MDLTECTFFDREDISGLNLIVRNVSPFNIGRPLRFDSAEEQERFLTKYKLHEKCASSNDYRIIIVWFGTKDNIRSIIPSGEDVTIRHLEDLNLMMAFYETKRIKGNETRLKKYLKN